MALSKKGAKPKATSAAPSTETPLPDWPAFKPLLATSDLSLSALVESQIVVIKSFWTSTLCKNYVSFLKTLPLLTTPGKPKKGDAVRVNDRFQIVDAGFANRLWIETGLRELVNGTGEEDDGMSKEERERLWGGEVIGLNPSIRIYRYTKGQFFDQHCQSLGFVPKPNSQPLDNIASQRVTLYFFEDHDATLSLTDHIDDESNLINLPTKPSSTSAKTTWTLLLYLTSPATGCEGGQTVFYPDDIPHRKTPIEREVVVELETGMLLLHKHGNDCMLHEGREVTDGEKWVIRSDLCVKR